jgi:hypothetical protein
MLDMPQYTRDKRFPALLRTVDGIKTDRFRITYDRLLPGTRLAVVLDLHI